ncbi:hypothetical protein ANANG_G00282130 [Anguilla anguilla]|uniref:Uncharacterized protein n=1 Tax=Anguilla anguilla TaxID=7936 RepID=A0A9D3RKM1_ANGAN|nr:hypothetical protein ANANG_G00282130 [Anguilla anguilla]
MDDTMCVKNMSTNVSACWKYVGSDCSHKTHLMRQSVGKVAFGRFHSKAKWPELQSITTLKSSELQEMVISGCGQHSVTSCEITPEENVKEQRLASRWRPCLCTGAIPHCVTAQLERAVEPTGRKCTCFRIISVFPPA